MRTATDRTGFTLLELVIVIAILAIITSILVVAINPAEMLARSRDARRVSDVGSLQTAINLYLAQATTTTDLAGGASAKCIGGSGAATFFENTLTASSSPSGFAAVAGSITQIIGASGWMPARIDQTSGGSPISALPLDPRNGTGLDGTYFYGYGCRASNNSFELTARLESNYYKDDLNIEGTDGGNSPTSYEVGSDLTIVPSGW